MRNKSKIITTFAFCIVVMCIIHSCKKEEQATSTDKEMYDMAKSTADFIWFKHSNALLNKSSGSAHPQPFLKTRYNTIAATKLNADGTVQTDAAFPEGSLIVKELYGNSTSLERYAILYKKPNNPDADPKGWVWGYINADGTVAEPASKKGSSCISCHSQANSIEHPNE